MPEVRLNVLTGDWVIIATERAKRPEDFTRTREEKVLPSHMDTCPFCSGNEDKTPSETYSIAGADGNWAVRAVPNKFSALTPEGEIVKRKEGFKQSLTGVGLHEVIVETPEHNVTTAQLPVAQIENILNTYRHRLMAFYEDPRIEHVIIFKNHGPGAGTSLEHPHSQIVGTPVFPGQVMNRLDEAIRNYYYVNFNECLYCSYLQDEINDGARIVAENESFVAFVPYAALSPFHVWIFPRTHRACFGLITDKEVSDLARMLKDSLLRIYIGLDDPDFNYMVRSLSPQIADAKYFHWYIAIVPRVSQAAGFELGTGMYINTASPEESARFLRNIKLDNLK